MFSPLSKVKFIAILLVGTVLATFDAAALDDTPENRKQEAERYLSVVSAKSLIDGMVTKMAANMPEEQGTIMVEALTKELNLDSITKAMSASMQKHFTADELKALADFYSQPIAKSAMAKMGDYMADVMPAVETQMVEAMERAQKAKEKPAPASAKGKTAPSKTKKEK